MQTEISKKVGENLRIARKVLGIPQKELAYELGKYQSKYCVYETGKSELNYEQIIYLCKRLDITPQRIIRFGIKATIKAFPKGRLQILL